MKRITGFSFITSLLLFALDRVTKYWAVISLSKPLIIIPQFLYFELMFNRGISWSLFSFESDSYFWALTVFVFGITIMAGWYAFYNIIDQLSSLGFLLICIGSLSNIIDRLLYKGVVDFININIGSFIWPSFNIADCAIVLGVLIMLWGQYKND